MNNSSLATLNIPAYTGNYTKGREGKQIKKITIHHMAARWTAQRCGESFQVVGRQGSSHYGIGYDGVIAQFVDEADTAWTDSNWESNTTSVTIETANDPYGYPWNVNDITLQSLIKLVADIAIRNNLGTLVKGQNLTWHQMYAATSCPGQYLISKMDYIVQEANKIINNGSDVIITRTPVTITYQVYDGAWLPNVTGHDANDNNNGYAGIIGNPISGVYIDASVGNIYYQVHTNAAGWLPEVKNREDYAGIFGQPIDGILIKSDNTLLHYQVHTQEDGWLPSVNGYNVNDHNNGYAGVLGHNIDAIMVQADDIITTTIVEKPKVEEQSPAAEPKKQLYRIRLSWEDTKSQAGAFSNLDAAIAQCPEGYGVYDIDGNEVFRREAIDVTPEPPKQEEPVEIPAPSVEPETSVEIPENAVDAIPPVEEEPIPETIPSSGESQPEVTNPGTTPMESTNPPTANFLYNLLTLIINFIKNWFSKNN